MADLTSHDIARYVVIAAVAYGLLRLFLLAPYRLWRSSQDRILSLEEADRAHKRSNAAIMHEKLSPKRLRVVEIVTHLKRGHILTRESMDDFHARLVEYSHAISVFSYDERVKEFSKRFEYLCFAYALAQACLFSCQARLIDPEGGADLHEQTQAMALMKPVSDEIDAVSEHLVALMVMDDDAIARTMDRAAQEFAGTPSGTQSHDLENGLIWAQSKLPDGTLLPSQAPTAKAVSKFNEAIGRLV